jgi:hypothetical protein
MRRFEPFRFIRSLNVLISLGVGLLLLSVLGYAVYQIYRETVQERVVSGIANVGDSQAVETQVSLSGFAAIEGTSYTFSPIGIEQTYRQSYYDKAALSTRNYLFLNLTDKSAGRLVPDNNWLFINAEKLGSKNKTGSFVKVQAFLYQVVKADTDGDKRLTELDRKTIALSNGSGKNYTEIIPQFDRILGLFQPKPSTVMLVYSQGEKNFVAEVNFVDRRVISTQELPAIH